MRLNFYLRGLEDPKLKMNWSAQMGEIVGRVKMVVRNSSPDYYVIPMSSTKTTMPKKPSNMIDYFKRNGVLVKKLKEDTGPYKKGTWSLTWPRQTLAMPTISLYQGFPTESAWAAMYTELLVNFPEI